jgi:DNA/RNA endonuclease YhcR with UshA esterase domain
MNSFRWLIASIGLMGLVGLSFSFANDDPPQGEKGLSPVEARKRIGENVLVEMTVRAAKDRLEKRGEIFLDSEDDFRDEKNFAVVITIRGADSLRLKGITDPATYFQDHVIRVRGTVKEVDEVPRIEVDDEKQIERGEKQNS